MSDLSEYGGNPELEQQILGALMTNNDLYHKVAHRLSQDMFYEPTHGRIFKKIKARIDAEHPATPVTLKSDLQDDEPLKELGGTTYLARMAATAISSFALPDYVDMLEIEARFWQMRDLVEQARYALTKPGESSNVRSMLEMGLTKIGQGHDKQNAVSFIQAATHAVSELANAQRSGNTIGLKTGFHDLDELIGGMRGGDIVIIGGRPSMGKTALALSIGLKVAEQTIPVSIVSLEMTESAIFYRALSDKTGINYSEIMQAKVTDDGLRKIVNSSKKLSELPLSIIPPHVREPSAIHAAIKSQRERWGGMGLAIIDYLQLVRAPGRDRVQQMTEASIQMKTMAKLLNIPVIVLAQLSRQVEQRDDKRPMLSDLRESGQIEQDADTVLFCYRDHYYLSREKPPQKTEARADYEAALTVSKNRMEVIVAKQRMGPTGTVRLGCHMATNRFWNLGDEQKQAEGFA
ncbi:MAG: DnaB-like helicase C-terminal domain-containing protein [Pseudomonadota bacterium]